MEPSPLLYCFSPPPREIGFLKGIIVVGGAFPLSICVFVLLSVGKGDKFGAQWPAMSAMCHILHEAICFIVLVLVASRATLSARGNVAKSTLGCSRENGGSTVYVN